MGRTSQVKRSTKETEIEVSLDLDGQGESEVDTGNSFFGSHAFTVVSPWVF